MFTNFFNQVADTFIIIELIIYYSLKLINDTRNKILGNAIFEMNEYYFQFTTIKNVFNTFINKFLVFKDIKPRYGRTRTRVFL